MSTSTLPTGYLTVDEVAARLGVSRNTVTYWIRQGYLEADTRSPRLYLVPERALRHFRRPKAGPPYRS